MKESDEKRKCPRIDVSVPLRFKKLYGDAYVNKKTEAINLSENGVRFESTYPISLNSRLFIEMSLPTAKKPVQLLSRVVWIKKLVSHTEDKYQFGNEFLSVKMKDLASIADYLKTLLP